MYYLSICAVVMDEGLYLREWFEYHIIQGVEHFFIYNNRSTDNTEDILKEYQSYGFVTYENMDDVPIQFKAYNKCLKEHGKESKWIAFIDIDEFLVRNSKDLQFAGTLEAFEKHPGLALYWLGFGSNGHKEYSPELVIERFTKRRPGPDIHVKSIVQPRLTVSVGSDPHSFYYKNGSAVNELFKKLPKNYAQGTPTAKDMWINHYWVKSYAEFIKSRQRGDSGTGRPYQNIEQAFIDKDSNDVEDLTAQFWAPAVTKMIEYRKTNVKKS